MGDRDSHSSLHSHNKDGEMHDNMADVRYNVKPVDVACGSKALMMHDRVTQAEQKERTLSNIIFIFQKKTQHTVFS